MRNRFHGILAAALIAACLLAGAVSSALAREAGDRLLDVLEKDYPPEAPLMPADMTIQTEYKDGAGEPVGLVDFVENEAYVVHGDAPKTAYKAAKSKPVFMGDSLIVQADSRLVVLLADQSSFSLGAYSKCVIDKSIYNPDKGFRETVLGLLAGKARFVVKKMKEFTSSDFSVETPVGTCGVRGSDFVMALTPENLVGGGRTSFFDSFSPITAAHAQEPPPVALVVVTGPDTSLGVTPTVGPPFTMSSFSGAATFASMPPLAPEPVSPSRTPELFNAMAPSNSVMSMPEVFE